MPNRSSTPSASPAALPRGIIEYLAEGAWTKRLHPGWAAQSGIRAALLARGGFIGPRTVFEGVHGLFHGFAHTTQGDYAALDDFGTRWVTETLAFKPYPCGTMAHPYIDCAKKLAARGIKPADVKEMICEVGEGTVHRLWEPLAAKQRPPNGYAAKFATPFILATGFVRGGVGLDAFTDEAVRDEDRARARRQGALRHRPEQSLSERLHRPHPLRRSTTAASSRRGNRISAAAPTSRSRAPISKRNSRSTRVTAAGTPRAAPPRSSCSSSSTMSRSISHRYRGK